MSDDQRVGWVRLPSWELAPFCSAPRHRDDGPVVLAGWLVALWQPDGSSSEVHPLCGDCVATMARDLGITVEQGTLSPPPLL